MALNLNASYATAVIGGALLMGLGAFLSIRRPRRVETLAVATYAGLFGLGMFLFWGLFILAPELGPQHVPILWVLAGLMLIADLGAGAGVAMLAVLYARRTGGGRRWTLLLPAALAILLTIHSWLNFLTLPSRPRGPWGHLAPAAFTLANFGAFAPFMGAMWFALLAAAFHVQPRQGVQRLPAGPWIALSAAVSIYVFQRIGSFLTYSAQQGLTSFITETGIVRPGLDEVVFFSLVVFLWVRLIVMDYRGAIPHGPWRQAVWALLLLMLAMVLLGQTTAAFYKAWGFADSSGLISGLSLILSALVLSYAVLRHQMFGLDLKVRWTLSKTALAAIFVATFFVASEAAQQFFGDRLGGPYVGILTAGALVFAFAPLSRFADRLAAKAIPPLGLGPGPASAREDAYRSTVRLALRGGLTRAEEVELARIAEANGISAARALELRRQVEDESVAGPRSKRRPGLTQPLYDK